jgi:hypothetical protein
MGTNSRIYRVPQRVAKPIDHRFHAAMRPECLIRTPKTTDLVRAGLEGRVMADYRVIFFNNLVNSYGKSFKCLQRIITVSSANDAGEASEKAKREFERLENVPNWKYHAQFLEVERANGTRHTDFFQ